MQFLHTLSLSRDHTQPITSGFNGTNLITIAESEYGHAFYLWDLRTGQLVCTNFPFEFYSDNSFAISSNGRVIFHSYLSEWGESRDNQWLRVYQVGSDLVVAGEALRIRNQGEAAKVPLTVASDNQTVFAMAIDSINIYRLSAHGNLSEVRSLPAIQGESLLISPDSKTLLTQSSKMHYLWDLQTWRIVQRFKSSKGWWADSLAVQPGGKTIASGTHQRRLKVWDLYQGQVLYTLPGQSPSVLSADGKMLVFCNQENEVLVWNLDVNQCLYRLQGHTIPVRQIALSPDQKYIVSSSFPEKRHDSVDVELKIWG